MSAACNTFQLELPGLREDNPRDFLATLGLLRLVDLLWPEAKVELGWNMEQGVPCIQSAASLPTDWMGEIVTQLKDLAERPNSPMFHGDVIKADLDRYRDAVTQAVDFGAEDHPLAELPRLLYSAYASQLPSESGDLMVSGFSFGNGQGGKKLLLDVKQLLGGIDADDLEAALAGTAKPRQAKTLRWNPAEFRPAAYRSHDPGAKHKGDEVRDVPCLNVLAFIGLTFFPTVPTSRGGATLGLFRSDSQTYFRWPIWAEGLTAQEVQTLMVVEPREGTGSGRRFRSRRFSSDKSLYLAPSEREF